ncbi:TonB-dependent receptor [Chitinophaga niabensis]|uniref:Iron complex outermembrane recepter protein n=1 Tax=Chitinophaga niabensis TaxID=536979 RepID=A0A1N6K5I3_9BACT|nr:TonB-dependent receptor [Chitinophaga niabensis]SIO51825.1 iron complex outermembrane recepter protein [Chitinophaga niabensis]
MKRFTLIVLIICYTFSLLAQQQSTVTIKDDETKEPLPGVTVLIKGTALTLISDSLGIVSFVSIPAGKRAIIFSYIGYETKEQIFSFPIEKPIEILLEPAESHLAEVQVTATRSSRSINDIPTRIETITAGELHEKAVMQPGNIRMLLTESTGIQTQQTSAVSGSASIRIQGLDGRYTLMLKDGFPLYGGFSGGLSILQIPPLDLKRVEVIKGSSSTLYGGGAIAGLVNLVTKEPMVKRELSFLTNVNQTGALDLNAYYGQKFNKIGITLFATRNSQAAYNNNHDDFSDIPRFTRYTLNPKFFYYPNTSTTVSLGLNTSFENRLGGDMQVIKGHANNTHSYFERNKTDRYATQFKLEKTFVDRSVLTLKNSIGYFSRTIELPDFVFAGKQHASFSEASFLLPKDKTEWVAGLSLVTDKFRQTSITQYPLDYKLVTGGIFVQSNWKPTEKFVLETGLRTDYTNQHDVFVLPRISAMYKFNTHFTSRVGGGLGYKAPNIFSEEAEEKSFRDIQPLVLSATRPERSTGFNVDINYKGRFEDVVSISINQLFFYTRLKSPLLLDTLPLANGNYTFYNADGYLNARGFETNIRLGYEEWSLYLGYTYTDAQRDFKHDVSVNPLTAKHRINCNVMYEAEDKWRIAYELFYTGRQQLTNGEGVRDYWVMGISGERKFKYFSVFLNFENLLDTRQSRWEPMYTGSIQHPDFREIYTPIDGFIFNGGFRITL